VLDDASFAERPDEEVVCLLWPTLRWLVIIRSRAHKVRSRASRSSQAEVPLADFEAGTFTCRGSVAEGSRSKLTKFTFISTFTMAAQDVDEPVVGSKRAHSPRPAPAKRAKAAQACLSCRKHKTRCEMLDRDNSGAQCHRCKVLSLSCSFEHGSGQSPGPSSAHGQQSECSAQPTIDRRSSVQLPKKPRDVPMDDTMKQHPKGWGDTFSDTPLPFRAPPREVEEVELLDPQRLLPEKHSPWGFLKLTGGFESTMVPILAIQALTRNGTSTAEPSRTKVDQTLFHVLSREEVKYLVDMCVSAAISFKCFSPDVSISDSRSATARG